MGMPRCLCDNAALNPSTITTKRNASFSDATVTLLTQLPKNIDTSIISFTTSKRGHCKHRFNWDVTQWWGIISPDNVASAACQMMWLVFVPMKVMCEWRLYILLLSARALQKFKAQLPNLVLGWLCREWIWIISSIFEKCIIDNSKNYQTLYKTVRLKVH
jgi:hypothetical protein